MRLGLLSKKRHVRHATDRRYHGVRLEHLIVDGTRSQESFRADNRLLSHPPQERDVVVRSTLNGQAPPPSCSDLLQVGPHVVSLRAPFREALISSRGRGSGHAP